MYGLELLDRLDELVRCLESEAAYHEEVSGRRNSRYAKGLSHGWCDGKQAAARRLRDELKIARAHMGVQA